MPPSGTPQTTTASILAKFMIDNLQKSSALTTVIFVASHQLSSFALIITIEMQSTTLPKTDSVSSVSTSALFGFGDLF